VPEAGTRPEPSRYVTQGIEAPALYHGSILKEAASALVYRGRLFHDRRLTLDPEFHGGPEG
jgi:hypothetical protein